MCESQCLWHGGLWVTFLAWNPALCIPSCKCYDNTPVSDYPGIPSKAPRGEALAWLCFTWPGIERVCLNPQEVGDKLTELKAQTASKHAVVISVSAGACVFVCVCVLRLFVCSEALITGVTGWRRGSLRHYWIYKKENPAFVSLGDPTAALISLWWSSRRHGACGSYPDVAASKTSPCLVCMPLSFQCEKRDEVCSSEICLWEAFSLPVGLFVCLFVC